MADCQKKPLGSGDGREAPASLGEMTDDRCMFGMAALRKEERRKKGQGAAKREAGIIAHQSTDAQEKSRELRKENEEFHCLSRGQTGYDSTTRRNNSMRR